jgi:hypothetical protein
MRPQPLLAVSVVLGRENMALMDANDLYAEDFGPFDGHIWLNTAHQGPLPRVAVEAARAVLEQKARPHLLRDLVWQELQDATPLTG